MENKYLILDVYDVDCNNIITFREMKEKVLEGLKERICEADDYIARCNYLDRLMFLINCNDDNEFIKEEKNDGYEVTRLTDLQYSIDCLKKYVDKLDKTECEKLELRLSLDHISKLMYEIKIWK